MKPCSQDIPGRFTQSFQPSDLNRLNIIHVAGTKGKGSTCAYVDSILSQYRQVQGKPPLKTGLFISPHLIAVRERIRINSLPVSKDLFASYFFDVWDRLASKPQSSARSPDDDKVPLGTRPTYARFLTLMSWHLFLQEGVDLAVYETGIGGEFDATNLVEKPLASGITSLGIDHVFALGDTIEKISWHKAGIMKTGCPAFTVKQNPAAAQVLELRAQEKHVGLKTVDLDSRLADVKIKPQAHFQKSNASLAVALAETALRKLGRLESETEEALPAEFIKGIEHMSWRGRCEVKKEGDIKWCLDGAHTADSIKMATKWFLDETQDRYSTITPSLASKVTNASTSAGPRILIFNQQGRPEALDFLTSLYTAAQSSPFTHVIFTTNLSSTAQSTVNPAKKDFINNQFDPAELAAMTVQRGFAERWQTLDPEGAQVTLAPSVEDALGVVRAEAALRPGEEEVQVFVTGSLHLVGAMLGILEEVDAL